MQALLCRFFGGPMSLQPEEKQEAKRVGRPLWTILLIPFRAIAKRYDSLRRRRMRRYREAFRHSTVRSSTLSYKLVQLLKRGVLYLRAVLSSFFSLIAPAILPSIACLLVFGCIWFSSRYTVALAVEVGDKIVGYVSDSEDFRRISDLVEAQVKNESLEQTGSELYLVESLYGLHYAIIPRDEFTSEDQLYDSLYAMASEYTRYSYGLFLDGELIATSKDSSVLNSVLTKILSYYTMDPSGDELEILNIVEIVKGEYPASYDLGYDRILDLFRLGSNLRIYTAKAGDSLESISETTGISVPVLCLMNGIDPFDGIYEGRSIVYGTPYHQLAVKNTLTVTYAEVVEYETEYLYSDQYFEGTLSEAGDGENGLYQIVTQQIYVNGKVSSSTEISRTEIKAPVSAKVLIGTKTYAPSGKFLFPLQSYSYVSSRFGWRWLRGVRNFHRGYDIAAAYGTRIYAADDGVIKEFGYEKKGLGWFVRIDHGNGVESIYGHASSLSKKLKKGMKVSRGDVIAYVGSTGNSTGNHLHFALYLPATKTYIDPEPHIDF